MSNANPESTSSELEGLFLGFLGALELDPDASIDALAAAHPEHARALRDMAERHRRLEALRRIALHDEQPPPVTSAESAREHSLRGRLAELAQPRAAMERYDVGPEIARGAQGSVHQSVDRLLGRVLAMKRLRPSPGKSTGSRGVQRFLDEAKLAAGLDHPAIVPIHDIGVDGNGLPFFTMKLVRGVSLAAAIEARRKDPGAYSLPRLVEALARVAEAMAFAHERGVLHRDLKPANIMLGDYGEVYVMDWGLARLGRASPAHEESSAQGEGRSAHQPGRTSDADTPTLAGDVIGTPHYMAPEQASGRNAELGPSADVYALGALLYHLISGSAPYAEQPSTTARQVLERVIAAPPQPLRVAKGKAPAELVAICERAMAREPADRYRDMRALSKDLRAWLEGRVVEAFERGALADLRKWIGRNPALAASVSAAVVAVVAGLAYSNHAQAQGRRLAQAAAQRADASLADLLRLSGALRVRDLRERAELLWPEVPRQLPALEAWLAEARALVAELPAHEASLAALRAGSATVEGLERAWWESTLAALVADLRVLESEILPDVASRQAFAASIEQRSVLDHRAAWDELLADISSQPAFAGQRMEPIPGLVPIGRDPRSGLWEFWHVRSGERPERDERGILQLSDATGIVLVLIPGGPMVLGAQDRDPSITHYDPLADSMERPMVRLRLDPFLIAKYELTQGQWLRATGSNPSLDPERGSEAGTNQTLRHPVDFVSWIDCQRVLPRLDLQLPTEAQWEYAARAGTTTPWWTGDSPQSLAGAGNVADAGALASGVRWESMGAAVDFDDGFLFTAPVGSFAANPWGLHDTIGNVLECCADPYSSYKAGRPDGDGQAPPGERTVLTRGGSYYFGVRESRCSARMPVSPDFVAPMIGARVARRLSP